ncbi:MAG: nitroreductase family protein [Lentisphaerae bacterium]|jgi:nitroreductase|nr:nitroreductase family protein [Lentisphaerota bacterium]MBT4821514.1 nitroreductase family protein [Lentisphaerota bacterium]MBT5608125.1 nitroreductase family protein [Lentisphaerota bacterium]MBT7060598.1 nitroreductase family protein [Lentisphaerota bacterium]MBT7847697.1 nitroreductase family protein [Lentisphaerota bacterium]
MNPNLASLFRRRSIRHYQNRPVGDAIVKDMLEAAMAAPSACCKDPWEFVVIRDPETLAEIASALPNGPMLAKAGVGFIVCGNMERAHDGALSYMLQDCSAAIENLLVAASSLGLGACWLGVHPREDRIAHVSRTLGLPAHVLPVSAIAVGWPGEDKEARTRYSADFVHHDAW